MSVLESLNGDYSPFLAADIEVISRPDSELRSQVTSALLRRGHRAGFVPLPVAPSRELDRFDLLVLEPDPGDPDALRICSTIRDFTRVPLLVISPYARKGFVDHTVYDTTSLLKFIETRWDLEPLATRDAAAADLTAAFDFSQSPAAPSAPKPVDSQDPRTTAPTNDQAPPTQSRSPVIPVTIGIAIVLVIVAAIIVVRRRRRTSSPTADS